MNVDGRNNQIINLDSSDDEVEDETVVAEPPPNAEEIFEADGIVIRQTNGETTDVVLLIDGAPSVQRRHGVSGRGHIFDPSAADKRHFKDRVAHMKANSGVGAEPMFHRDDDLFVKAVFRIPRPARHFVGNRVGNAVRALFEGVFSRRNGDIDNYAKFVLDAMNSSVYVDDRQVAALLAIKCNDCTTENVGSTEIRVAKMDGDDLEEVLNW